MLTSRARTIRWWPLILVVVAAVAAITFGRMTNDADRQRANMITALVVVVALLATLIWAVAGSRLRGRARAGGALLVLAPAVVLVAGFRIKGVTGDLVPILEWRWRAVGDTPGDTRQPVRTPRSSDPALTDYPQFFGPARDGKLAGPALARDWARDPPVEIWRRPVGAGWSGFAVRGGCAVTQEQHGDDEAVVCYDATTGARLWIDRYPARYETTLGGLGPRATPTIDGGKVYAQGATGVLRCLDLMTGRLLWSRHVLDENAAPLPDWGVAGSPLVVRGKVIVSAGGPNGRSLVAYDAATGEPAWRGGSGAAHYSSPVLAELAGVRQVLIFNAREVAGHALADGKVLWTHPWKADHPHVCMPAVLDGDRVLVSSGYGTGSQLLAIGRTGGGFRVRTLWRSLRLKAKFTNVVAFGGHVYGLDDGILTRVDLQDGKRRWKRGRYGHGQVIKVGERLLVTTESGEVVLLAPAPDAPNELGRFRWTDGKTWNPPALAGAFLLLRSDAEAACYRLAVAE